MNPESAVRAVFKVPYMHVGEREEAPIRQVLPADIRVRWPRDRTAWAATHAEHASADIEEPGKAEF